jgi:hypothetical protein
MLPTRDPSGWSLAGSMAPPLTWPWAATGSDPSNCVPENCRRHCSRPEPPAQFSDNHNSCRSGHGAFDCVSSASNHSARATRSTLREPSSATSARCASPRHRGDYRAGAAARGELRASPHGCRCVATARPSRSLQLGPQGPALQHDSSNQRTGHCSAISPRSESRLSRCNDRYGVAGRLELLSNDKPGANGVTMGGFVARARRGT